MRTVWYWAVIEQHEGEYWVTLPDLPGPNAVDADVNQALRLLAEFAAEHVADLVERRTGVPTARSVDAIEHDPDVQEWGRALVPVDIPGGAPVKISLSIDEGLLARADRAAAAEGMTRSGFVAAALGHRLRGRVQSVEPHASRNDRTFQPVYVDADGRLIAGPLPSARIPATARGRQRKAAHPAIEPEDL